ncbi:MAG: NAD-dependent epimerase/dehydratase family protein [Terricaulis sp.]
MARVLVTGASGFVGSALVAALSERGWAVRAASRTRLPFANACIVGDLGPDTDWRAALEGVDAVVHLAGPAHARYSAAELERAIVLGAAALAAQARAAGVSRFVFVSSIKAIAAHAPGSMLAEGDAPNPQDRYGRAKLSAEREVLEHVGEAVLVLRPPLVFGADAKRNFRHLLAIADTNIPLPFAGIENRRSLISLASLIEAILATLTKRDGPSGVFHVADRPALSTPAIIDALRRGLGRPTRQFSAPGISMFTPPALTESLAIDDSHFRTVYGYGPRTETDVSAALEQCARDWKAGR